jgi:hypothetical protein
MGVAAVVTAIVGNSLSDARGYACTVIQPSMAGWMLQKNGYSPAVLKVNE